VVDQKLSYAAAGMAAHASRQRGYPSALHIA
jgi:hypothetical protein